MTLAMPITFAINRHMLPFMFVSLVGCLVAGYNCIILVILNRDYPYVFSDGLSLTLSVYLSISSLIDIFVFNQFDLFSIVIGVVRGLLGVILAIYMLIHLYKSMSPEWRIDVNKLSPEKVIKQIMPHD